MLYFAYGSNLSSVRLIQRVPSVRLVAIGTLFHHRLAFHKIGLDGSAKCDAYFTGNRDDFILGAVYRISPSHKPRLDRAEGLGKGYITKMISVVTKTGEEIQAFLYSATSIDRHRKPFHWYKEHVLQGMREHDFPDRYIANAAAVQSVADHDMERAERELQIYSSGKIKVLY